MKVAGLGMGVMFGVEDGVSAHRSMVRALPRTEISGQESGVRWE